MEISGDKLSSEWDEQTWAWDDQRNEWPWTIHPMTCLMSGTGQKFIGKRDTSPFVLNLHLDFLNLNHPIFLDRVMLLWSF